MTDRRPRLATVWLGGCSGCHMSLLDLDERLLELAQRADVVFSPIADVKEFPADVDVTLIEGAVANEDHLEMLRATDPRAQVRRHRCHRHLPDVRVLVDLEGAGRLRPRARRRCDDGREGDR